MSRNRSRDTQACGCCTGVSVRTPATIHNRPGLSKIDYRVGRHAEFKQSLLARLSGAQAAAITTVFFVDEEGHAEDGRILDADIELNGAHGFFFTVNGSSKGTDVQNTVTHELGHLMGLDHPCDDGARRPLPRDHLGQRLPSCDPRSKLPVEMTRTTMFNFTEPGDTFMRTPEADDVAGVCSSYPLAQDPGQCIDVDLTPGCACSALGARPAGQGARVAGVPLMPVLAFAIPVMLLWLRRRRRAD